MKPTSSSEPYYVQFGIRESDFPNALDYQATRSSLSPVTTRHPHNFLSVDGLRVKYTGPGSTDSHAASIRANKPVPRGMPFFYYEVLVLNEVRYRASFVASLSLSPLNNCLQRSRSQISSSYVSFFPQFIFYRVIQASWVSAYVRRRSVSIVCPGGNPILTGTTVTTVKSFKVQKHASHLSFFSSFHDNISREFSVCLHHVTSSSSSSSSSSSMCSSSHRLRQRPHVRTPL